MVSQAKSGRMDCSAWKRACRADILAKCAAVALFAALPIYGGEVDEERALVRQIGYAEHYVKEFENEVARQRGGEKWVWRTKNDALMRVQELKKKYPNDPRVENLYQRTRTALKKSKGDYTEVAAEWTAYLHNEENLRKVISEAGEKEWQAIIAAHQGKIVEKPFPAPDSERVALNDLKGMCVILDDVEYPAKQFYGASGEFIYSGRPSAGFWFIDLAGRDWLGPYEAVKRYRRNVDSGMAEVEKWTVLAEIGGIAAENPYGGEHGVGTFYFGWVVKPIALKVPGHVVAVYDKDAESSGRFIGEERVDEIKNGWYTVKEVPADVAPDRLMEIFMTAIKEKNMKLYLECIDPECRKGVYGEDESERYFWDLHQERFHREYVHATFSKPVIKVQKGFDRGNSLEGFFLDDDDKKTLERIGGELVEEAVVESRAYDKNGKQLGTPHEHRLRRRGGGRWYVLDYQVRF